MAPSDKDNDSELSKNDQIQDSFSLQIDKNGIYIPYTEKSLIQFGEKIFAPQQRSINFFIDHELFEVNSKDIEDIFLEINNSIKFRDTIKSRPNLKVELLYIDGSNENWTYIIEENDQIFISEGCVIDKDISKLTIIISYLIEFNDNPLPFKQDIFITFDTKLIEIQKLTNSKNNLENLVEFIGDSKLFVRKKSDIEVNIYSTEIMWAKSLTETIKNKIDVRCSKEIIGWRKAYKVFNPVLIGIGFLIIILYIPTEIILLSWENKVDIFKSEIDYPNILNYDIEKKINTLIEFVVNNYSLVFGEEFGQFVIIVIFSFLMIGFVFFTLSIVLSQYIIKPYDRSFINLSDKAYRNMKLYKKKYKNSFLIVVLMHISAIIASMQASYIEKIIQFIINGS